MKKYGYIFIVLLVMGMASAQITVAAESTSSVTINGSPVDDSIAVILKITESGGSYTVTKDGMALTPTSGIYTVSSDVSFIIEDGKMVVIGSNLPIDDTNPAQYMLTTGTTTDFTFLKAPVSNGTAIEILPNGYVFFLQDTTLESNGTFTGSPTTSNTWVNNGSLVVSGNTSGVFFAPSAITSGGVATTWSNTGDVYIDTTGRIYLTAATSASGATMQFTNSGNLILRSEADYVENQYNIIADTMGALWHNTSTGIIDIQAKGDIYMQASGTGGGWLNDGIINIDTTGKLLHLRSNSTGATSWTNNGDITIQGDSTFSEVDMGANGGWLNTGNIQVTGRSFTAETLSMSFPNIENTGTLDVSVRDNIKLFTAWGNIENFGEIQLASTSGFAMIRADSHFKNDGTIILSAGTIVEITAYGGTWTNNGILMLENVSGNMAYIGVHRYGPTTTSKNYGLIEVLGATQFSISGANAAGAKPIDNYGTILFSEDSKFGWATSEAATFNEFSDYLKIINYKSIDIDLHIPASHDGNQWAAVNDLETNYGIDTFKILRLGRVFKEDPNGDIYIDGKVYTEKLGTDGNPGYDVKAAMLALDSNEALYINYLVSDLPDAGELKASIYSIYGLDADGSRPAVNPYIILTKTGSDDLLLSGMNSWYNGVINLDEGSFTVEGPQATLFGGVVNLANDTSITLGGMALQTVNTMTFSGNSTLIFSPAAYHHLTTNNIYLNNTNIFMNTALGADPDATDRILITDSVFGKGILHITPTFGPGTVSDDGIKVVDIAPSLVDVEPDTFMLYGDKIDNGPTEYMLYQGAYTTSADPNSFYLRDTGVMSGPFKTMTNVPTMLMVMANTAMDSLHLRMAYVRHSDNHCNDLWARTYGKRVRVDDAIRTNMDLFGFEAGYDRRIWLDADHTLYVGVMGGYLLSRNIDTDRPGRINEGDASAPSVGAYATLLSRDGYYVDLALRYFWANFDLVTYNAQLVPMSYKPSQGIFAANVEVGKQIPVNSFRIEPNLRLAYAYAGGSTVLVTNGDLLEYDPSHSLNLRAGIKANYINSLAFSPYVKLGIGYEFLGKTDVTYGGLLYRSSLAGIGGDVAIGFDASPSKDWNFYGEINYERYTNVSAFGFNVGIRYAF